MTTSSTPPQQPAKVSKLPLAVSGIAAVLLVALVTFTLNGMRQQAAKPEGAGKGDMLTVPAEAPESEQAGPNSDASATTPDTDGERQPGETGLDMLPGFWPAELHSERAPESLFESPYFEEGSYGDDSPAGWVKFITEWTRMPAIYFPQLEGVLEASYATPDRMATAIREAYIESYAEFQFQKVTVRTLADEQEGWATIVVFYYHGEGDPPGGELRIAVEKYASAGWRIVGLEDRSYCTRGGSGNFCA